MKNKASIWIVSSMSTYSETMEGGYEVFSKPFYNRKDALSFKKKIEKELREEEKENCEDGEEYFEHVSVDITKVTIDLKKINS